MEGWQIGLLVTAAEFTGHFLKLRLAILMRGDDPWLLLQVVADPDVDVEDDDDARWSSGFRAQVPTEWPREAGNPWYACAYSGHPKVAVGDIERLINGGKNAGARLADLIDTHLDGGSFDLETRRMLLGFIKNDFQDAGISTLVRPAATNDGYDLSLHAAYEIHRAVAAGKRLNVTQRRQAAVLLKYAPWQFGYWGPFKAVVKSVPADSLADAYGEATARLSSTDGSVTMPEKIAIESVEELDGWFGIPSTRTQQYLARRVRRDLASLAEESPDAYARVAARLLISWDQPLSNYSYAPAFVMLGAQSPLDSRSRYVYRPAGMAERRDPHPEIWNARPELAYRVFRSVRHSVEALTWSFQVLESAGTTPELPPASVGLALESSYLPLRQLACSTLPRRRKLFDALTQEQWAVFFDHGSDTDVVAVAGSLARRQTERPLVAALGAVMARDEEQSERRSRLARLYLAASQKPYENRDESEFGAVSAVIRSSGVKHRSLWAPVVARMDDRDVVRLYRSLVESGVSAAALDVVAKVLLKEPYHPPGLILECLGSQVDKVVELGWRIVDSRGGRQFLFTQLLPSAGYGTQLTRSAANRVLKSAFQRVEQPTDLVALLRWAMSAGIDGPAVTRILSKNRMGLNAVWNALSSDTDGRIARWVDTTPEVIPLIAGALSDDQIYAATPAQLRPILDFVGSNPGRIAQEEQFRLAAIRSGDAKLQTDGLTQLRRANALPGNWLHVAESGSAAGLDAARKYLESLKGAERVRQSILECLSSSSPGVQTMGIELVHGREAMANDPEILTALCRFDNRLAQYLVADAASSGWQMGEAVLRDFDRRVLTDRQASPSAKELVKKRLEALDVPSGSDSPERIAAVLQMARIGNKGDREWALMLLASWALHGAEIDGLEVSLTTEGVVGLEDVAP
jgi:hypothetical protein